MVMNTIPALSIQQPWAWLITHGYKEIENRDWQPTYRGRILIHAGKKGDEGWYVNNEPVPGLWKHYLHTVKGLTHIELPATKAEFHRDHQLGGIVGIATLADVVSQSDSHWFVGRYGLVLKDAQPLPFLPYRGQRKLFPVNLDEVLAHLAIHAPQLQIRIAL